MSTHGDIFVVNDIIPSQKIMNNDDTMVPVTIEFLDDLYSILDRVVQELRK